MKYILVDIESDGPIPHLYSMLSLGAVELDNPENTWYDEFQPLHGAKSVEATEEFLRQNNLDRRWLLKLGANPQFAMRRFNEWLTKTADGGRLRFVSDNAGFDWQFVNYYLYRFVGDNPFGFSPLSLTSLYAGFAKNMKKQGEYKRFRETKHSHNALDDALGNEQAMRKIREMGMQF